MKPSVDGSSSASENHAPEIRLTRITAQRPARLSKSFQMVGNVLTKKSGGDMVDGVAERLTVNTVAEFAALLPTLTPKQAISYAVNGHDVARVVTADYLDKARAQGGDLPIIARTRDHFAWPDGPGILMVDYDAPEPGAPLDKAELRAALTAACPALADAPAVWRPSASSCIYTAEGAELRGIAGQRFYFAVLAAQDIPRAGQVLFDRLWLAGFGRYELSKSGAFLIRSVMDASVFQPERLDFCGGAATAKGLVQRLPEPALFNPDAPYLDTRAALPDLTADERQRLTELREALKGPLRERQREIRSAWIDARVAAGLARLPVAEHEQARPALERTYRQAAEGGRLDAGFELIVVVKGGKARKTLTVGEILRNRAQYHEAKTLDPLEPDYPQGQARLVGWLNLNARPPYLKSQAHGGTRYDLGAEACADAPELDEGYWESMFNDSLSREKVSNNPSHSSHSSQSITYTFLTRHQPVPPVPFTLSAPELTTFDEKGRTVVLVDSKGAAAVAVALTGRLAFCRFTLTWYGFTDTYWQPLAGSIADGLITRLIYAGSTECGFEARYATAVTSLLRKGLLPLPDTAAGNSRLLPFANGLLDPVTRNLTAITPDNALTWSLPYPYDPSADCPALRAWLKQAVDDDVETVEFLRAWLAALLTGRADLQKFLHLLGAGGTGKGAFIRLATALVGQHNAQVTDLKNLEQNRFEAAALYGKRLAVISDTDKYGGSVNNLKALTGQDHLRLERKNQQQNGTFVFDGLVLLASNEAIQTTDYTGALERRRMTVLFDRIATDAERRLWDAQGGETMVLHREIPGLVNWCLALRREDVTRIITQRPARVIEADTNALRASNPVAEWMMECTIPDPDHKAKIGDKRQVQRDGRTTFDYAEEWLYPNYLTWCQRCGREGLSLVRFSALVIDVARILKAPVRKGKQGDLGRYLKGLRLRGDLENRYDWAATRPTVTGLGRVKDAQPIEKDEGDGWDGFSPQTYLHTREEKFNDTPPPPPTGHPGHPGHPIPPRSENFAAGKKPTSYREVF